MRGEFGFHSPLDTAPFHKGWQMDSEADFLGRYDNGRPKIISGETTIGFVILRSYFAQTIYRGTAACRLYHQIMRELSHFS